ncbi:MAG: helix-turn-helix transcriptional regulator [Magnetococcales bacterium]|nr:helix-turn-helix transcriptional regulator [Magnetococcales bacterium]
MSDDLNGPNFLKAIGQRLKTARQSAGLSQRDVCAALGVGTSAWNHWEMGRRSPDLLTLIRFTQTYGLSAEWILRGELSGFQFTREQMIAIACRIKAARIAMELEFEEIAAAIEVEVSALARWEAGETAPDFHAMTRLASLFHITLDWIFLGIPSGLPARLVAKTVTLDAKFRDSHVPSA